MTTEDRTQLDELILRYKFNAALIFISEAKSNIHTLNTKAAGEALPIYTTILNQLENIELTLEKLRDTKSVI